MKYLPTEHDQWFSVYHINNNKWAQVGIVANGIKFSHRSHSNRMKLFCNVDVDMFQFELIRPTTI